MFFKFWKETSIRDIDTYRYKIPDEYYYSPERREENACYCIEDSLEKCNTNGLLDISRCFRRTYGAPIVMSSPYFLHGDTNLTRFKLDSKKELNDENYGTYLDIEPVCLNQNLYLDPNCFLFR